MKKRYRVILIIVALFVGIFFACRYGWRLFGTSMCADASVEEITVEDRTVTIKGMYPGSWPAFFVGSNSRMEDGNLYVGLKFNNILGVFPWETGNYSITIDVKEDVKAIYLQYGDRLRTIWKAVDENADFSDDAEGKDSEKTPNGNTDEEQPIESPEQGEVVKSLIDPSGMTLATRILTPDGYTRTSEKDDSLANFLRDYGVKEDGSDVLLYDGSPKGSQNDHVAVLTLPIENRNLQQCADSVMRVYAEYYWSQKAYDKISFHFTNGFKAPYKKWQDGYRIKVSGNDVKWVQSASYDDSYDSFKAYLKTVFCYAGTLSMSSECTPIQLEDIRVGDVFLKGGSPGHVVMVVDTCVNAEGKKAFLLAQGYMPAQEFHVLKNIQHEENPWYYEDEVEYPFITPEYTFEDGSLQRPEY